MNNMNPLILKCPTNMSKETIVYSFFRLHEFVFLKWILILVLSVYCMHRIMLHGFMNTGFKETKKEKVNTNHLWGGGGGGL